MNVVVEHLIVVHLGGCLRAVRAARGATHRGRITGPTRSCPLDKIPLQKFLAQELEGSPDDPPLRTTSEELVDELGIEVQLSRCATWVDPPQGLVGVGVVAFDALVIATGSAAGLPDGPISERAGSAFRTL
jgi:NAD(P)H-nitrite reductase large subunit